MYKKEFEEIRKGLDELEKKINILQSECECDGECKTNNCCKSCDKVDCISSVNVVKERNLAEMVDEINKWLKDNNRDFIFGETVESVSYEVDEVDEINYGVPFTIHYTCVMEKDSLNVPDFTASFITSNNKIIDIITFNEETGEKTFFINEEERDNFLKEVN